MTPLEYLKGITPTIDDNIALMPPLFLDEVTTHPRWQGGYHVCGHYPCRGGRGPTIGLSPSIGSRSDCPGLGIMFSVILILKGESPPSTRRIASGPYSSSTTEVLLVPGPRYGRGEPLSVGAYPKVRLRTYANQAAGSSCSCVSPGAHSRILSGLIRNTMHFGSSSPPG